MIRKVGDQFKLLVIIVKKGLSRKVVKACKEGGSEGGTVIQGRGTGTHDAGTVLGVKIEPEKDVILSLVADEEVDDVLKYVTRRANLDKPGTGIAFVINSRSVTGIAHLLKKDF